MNVASSCNISSVVVRNECGECLCFACRFLVLSLVEAVCVPKSFRQVHSQQLCTRFWRLPVVILQKFDAKQKHTVVCASVVNTQSLLKQCC